MSKELNNISTDVINQIRNGQIKMRPKIYFILGSIFIMIGLIASVISSVFLISLTSFLLRSHGPMGEYRLQELLNSFSWWILVFMVVSIVAGVIFLRKYNFSYKYHFTFVIIGFVLSIFIAGIIINISGMDKAWLSRGPIHNTIRHRLQKDCAQEGYGCKINFKKFQNSSPRQI